MKIWNRQLTLDTSADAVGRGVPSLVAACEYFNANGDTRYSLWQGLLGPVGSLAVSARIDSFGGWVDGNAEILARADTQMVFARVFENLSGPPEDSVWNVVHGAGDVSEVPNVAANVFNRYDMDQMPAAVAQAVDFADFTHELTGTAVTVSTSVWATGPAVRMIWGYSSATEFEQRTEAAMTSPEFAEKVAANASGPKAIESQSAVGLRIL